MDYPSLYARATKVCALVEDVVPGALFVALIEDGFDGHDDLDAAFERGAQAAVVHRKCAASIAQHVVASTTHAWGELANIHRRGLAHPIIAVTGSAGKTSTKELIAAALDAAKTEGNRNNLHGAPQTLLRFDGNAAYGVVEIGTSEPGEIGRLAAIVAPDVGVITNIGRAHLKGLGSIEGVAREKLALWSHCATAVVNLDDPRLSSRAGVTFSAKGDPKARVRITDVERVSPRGIVARVVVDGRPHTLRLRQPAAHNLANAAAALAVVVALEADVAAALARMERVASPAERFALHRMADCLLIDDCYNANPDSVRASVRSMLRLARNDLAPPRPALVCLGDMLELGDDAAALHAELGGWLASMQIDGLYCIGVQCAVLADAATRAGLPAKHFEDIAELSRAVVADAAKDSVILVKGSRGSSMDRAVKAMLSPCSG